MGTFIPIRFEQQDSVSSYADYLDRLKYELEESSFQSLSRFCLIHKISYPEFKRYLKDNEFDFTLLKRNDVASPALPPHKSAALTSVTIKLNNRTEIHLSSVLPSQLLQIIKAL